MPPYDFYQIKDTYSGIERYKTKFINSTTMTWPEKKYSIDFCQASLEGNHEKAFSMLCKLENATKKICKAVYNIPRLSIRKKDKITKILNNNLKILQLFFQQCDMITKENFDRFRLENSKNRK